MNGAVSDVQPPQGAKRDSYLVTEQDTSLFFYCFQTAQREIKLSLGNGNRKRENLAGRPRHRKQPLDPHCVYMHTEGIHYLDS